MKSKNFFIASMLAFALVACDNDLDDKTTPDGTLKGYITLNVKAPELRTTQTGQVDPSQGSESTISNVTIVLTNEAGVVQQTAKVGMLAGNQTQTVPAAVNPGSYYVYALVNYTGVAPSGNIQRVIDVATAVEATNGYNNGSFLMVNTYNGGSTVGATGGVQGTITTANTVNSPLNVAITVDRVAVKIADENNYATTPPNVDSLSVNSNSVVDGVVVNGFVPLNVNQQFNLIQKWEQDGADNVLSTPLYTTSNRTITDQYFHNITEYATVSMSAGQIDSITNNTVAGDFALGIVYATENRPTYSQMTTGEFTSGMGETTGVIYRVVAQNAGNPVGTFYKYGSTISTNWSDIAAIDATLPATAPAPADYPGLRGKGVKIYEGGVMYYSHFIKDVNTNHQLEGENYYGVFRNSAYRLTVNSISALGDDVPGGGVVTPENPNPPIDNETTYIDVTVTINPWVLNTINIDF